MIDIILEKLGDLFIKFGRFLSPCARQVDAMHGKTKGDRK